MAPIAFFQAATRLAFGPGAAAQAGEVSREAGISRALLVTDPGVANAGLAGRIVESLAKAGVDSIVFDTVEPNPSLATVEGAIRLYRESNCNGVVTVGGGSPMDVAKAVAILATNPGDLMAYVGIGKVVNPLAPLLAIPTTVGTGSEVTNFAVITNTSLRRKLVVGSPLLAPRYALLDPELVLSLPAGLVAATGMDALTHAIESVISNFASPFSDGLALEAIAMVAANLPAAVRPDAPEARTAMLYASTMAGMAFSFARTGLVHGMSHPLSSYCGVPHGLANAILLPYVLAFNAPTCQAGLARVAQAMGMVAEPQAAIEAVRRLNASVGIPAHLREAGVTEEFIPAMANDAFESGNAQVVNPRKPSLSEVVELYHQAL